jgi:hypothetical protein
VCSYQYLAIWHEHGVPKQVTSSAGGFTHLARQHGYTLPIGVYGFD